MDGSAITYFQVTDAIVAPLVKTINSGLETMIPIGIGIMGSFIGVSIMKRVIYSFI